ncbi:MAG TPA: HAD-IIA family hydrolase [Acidimicrobiales bacterium]|nr:HAD-IIA family hydrolase [Acidimicrobiales bacterium]
MSPDPEDERLVAPGAIWIVDLDGVVWLAGEPIGEVAGAVSKLRNRGVRILFATNNSAPTIADLVSRLGHAGIPAGPEDLVTSSQAAASLLDPGSTAMVLTEGGALEALEARGVSVRETGPVDAVVIGWTRHFDFDSLTRVSGAVRDGARLIGTNEDPTYPTPTGPVPGAGALLAAVATAGGIDPEIAGKPHPPTVALLRSRLDVDGSHGAVIVVGDRPMTDGHLAIQLGVPFALVDSGVTPPDDTAIDVPVHRRAKDFAALVDQYLTGR